MSLLLTGGTVFSNGRFENKDLAIDQGRIVSVSPSRENCSVIELHNCLIVSYCIKVACFSNSGTCSYTQTQSLWCYPRNIIKFYIKRF